MFIVFPNTLQQLLCILEKKLCILDCLEILIPASVQYSEYLYTRNIWLQMNIDTVILSSHTAYFKRSHRNKFLLPVVIYFIQDLCDSFSSKLLTGTPFYKNLTDASYASLVSTSVASSAMTPIKHVYLTLSEILHFSSSVIATRKFLQALSGSGL